MTHGGKDMCGHSLTSPLTRSWERGLHSLPSRFPDHHFLNLTG